MKKIMLPIILVIMVLPFMVNAETCDTDKISISSITVEEKSDNVEEIDKATASGKNINLNLSMSEVGDNINYKIVVKNDSNDDYELDKNSFNISSDYIDYTLESDDNSYIVKANSSKTVYLKVEYKTEVPDEVFESGTYNDNKTMALNLSTVDTINVPDTLTNPNTGDQSYILIILIILIISGSMYVLLRKRKYTKFMVLIIGTAIILPISVYAICKCEIKIESNIKILNEIHEFCYLPPAQHAVCGINSSNYTYHNPSYYEYIPGETFGDYFERNNLFIDSNNSHLGYSDGTSYGFDFDTFWSFDSTGGWHVSSGSWKTGILDKKIQGKEMGCYSACAD